MGNRAVLTHYSSNNAPCIYLHWNGGRDSVAAFLHAARYLGLPPPTTERAWDLFAKILAKHFFGGKVGMTIYREKFGEADKDNWDNGVYYIDRDWRICGREFNRHQEQYDPETTSGIFEHITGAFKA